MQLPHQLRSKLKSKRLSLIVCFNVIVQVQLQFPQFLTAVDDFDEAMSLFAGNQTLLLPLAATSSFPYLLQVEHPKLENGELVGVGGDQRGGHLLQRLAWRQLANDHRQPGNVPKVGGPLAHFAFVEAEADHGGLLDRSSEASLCRSIRRQQKSSLAGLLGDDVRVQGGGRGDGEGHFQSELMLADYDA